MFWQQVQASGNATEILDIQGFSHQSDSAFLDFHIKYPEKPLVATECCSCESQRGEDADLPHGANATHTSWTQSCTASQSQTSNGKSWIAGTYTWTLHE